MYRITNDGKLELSAMLHKLDLRHGSVLIFKCNYPQKEFLESLAESIAAMRLPFTVPVLVLSEDESIYTIDRSVLETALEIERD